MECKRVSCAVTNDLNFDQRMQKTCISLAQAGYDVTLIGRKLRKSIPVRFRNIKSYRMVCLFNKGPLFYAEYNFKLFFKLLFSKQDIICSVDLDTLVACSWAARIKNKKLIFDAHEFFVEVPEVVNRKWVKKIWHFIEQQCVPKAHAHYTVGPELANLFSQRLGCKFEVVRNMPYKRTASLNNPPQKPYFILYQGALNPARGIEAMIDAMVFLKGIEFHIVGSGPLEKDLKARVSKNKLENKVRFLGYMEPEELAQYTQKAFLGLNVSEPLGLSYYYSLNNKFFDYIQAGVPSLINAFPEYIKLNNQYEVGVLCESNPQQLASKTNTLLKDSNKYNYLKQQCIKAANELNWENEQSKLLSIYESV